MTNLPPGAGPEAGSFSGTIYMPPAAAPAGTAGATTTATRPLVATTAATLDSAGRMVAKFTAPATAAWEVERIVVQSTVRSQALVYVGTAIEAENLVSGTIAGNLDENDANQPYLVAENQSMFVHWVGGGTCRARIEYREV